MRRRELLLLLGGMTPVARTVQAQQKPMPVIGFLGSTSPGPIEPALAAFRQGLLTRCQVIPRSLDGALIRIDYYPHADQVRQASRLQLLDNVGAVQLDGAKADAEMASDNLIGLARGHQLEYRSSYALSFQCNARSMLSSNASSRSGFSMKSKAPAFIAAIASGTVP